MIDGTNLPAELRFTQFNEIPVLVIDHEIGQATISLQGAQLLSWKPKHQQEILWLSEIEPFTLGNAIRGGIPLCYPWFGNAKKPIHGTARLRLWELHEYAVQADKSSSSFMPNNRSSCCKNAMALGRNFSPKSVSEMERVLRLNKGSPSSFSNSFITRLITCGDTEKRSAVDLKLKFLAAATKYLRASSRFIISFFGIVFSDLIHCMEV